MTQIMQWLLAYMKVKLSKSVVFDIILIRVSLNEHGKWCGSGDVCMRSSVSHKYPICMQRCDTGYKGN